MDINFYRIIGGDEEYIGSTSKTLQERFANHKYTKDCSSHQLFNKYGIDNCRIELIERRVCSTPEERYKYEGELIKASSNCINKNMAGRTRSQYYQENKERLLNLVKQNYEENRNQKIEYLRRYREANRDKLRKADRERYALKKSSL